MLSFWQGRSRVRHCLRRRAFQGPASRGRPAVPARFAGVGKTDDEIELALREGIYCFNVESEPELERINEIAGRLRVKAPVAIRVNPDVDAKTHKYISTGKSLNKFGIGLDRARGRLCRVRPNLPHLALRGIQTHIGSQILEPEPFAEAAAKLVLLAGVLRDLYRYRLLQHRRWRWASSTIPLSKAAIPSGGAPPPIPNGSPRRTMRRRSCRF